MAPASPEGVSSTTWKINEYGRPFQPMSIMEQIGPNNLFSPHFLELPEAWGGSEVSDLGTSAILLDYHDHCLSIRPYLGESDVKLSHQSILSN